MTERDQEGRMQTKGGVQSIFTEDQSRRKDALPAIGLLAMGGGVTIWAWALRNIGSSNGVGTSQGVAWSVLTLSSMGMLTVLIGTGLFAYSFAARRTRMGGHTFGFSVRSNESMRAPKNELLSADSLTTRSLDPTWGLKSAHRASKTFLVAIVESSVLIASYGSLVTEYETEPRLQAWVQTNLPLASLFLNYYVVLLLTGLLGVLVTPFFPRKHLSHWFLDRLLNGKTFRETFGHKPLGAPKGRVLEDL